MPWSVWGAFAVLVGIALALDLGVFHRNPHKISLREAGGWTVAWILLALGFNLGLYLAYEHGYIGSGLPGSGKDPALRFLTAYIIEKALSLDNIFVIALIFAYFKVPAHRQHKVLYWGILGAIFFRGLVIFVGTSLVNAVWWINYLFGALLLYSAYKMASGNEEEPDLENNRLVKILRRILPLADHYEGGRFFIRQQGRLYMTPLFLVLIVIELSDILFAVDSVPAIFSITTDFFLVFSSNIFAILGLRSLYFVLAAMLDRFRYLQVSLIFVLGFVGIKLMLMHHYQLPIWLSLSVIVGLLSAGVLASWWVLQREKALAKKN
jgi:tellurite resistance protein TerC